MKTIVLSDLHLGQSGKDGSGFNSVLTKIPQGTEQFNQRAVKYRENLLNKIKDFSQDDKCRLILAGDALDLSLATFNDCLKDLKSLIQDLSPCLSQLVLVVGNHDHHLWMMHQEYKSLIKPMLEGREPFLYSPYRSTLTAGSNDHPLTNFIGLETILAYPIYRIRTEHGYQLTVNHGHLHGDIYNLFSRILQNYLSIDNPTLNTAAEINFPLIEFMYWLVGEMGDGMGVDGIMEMAYSDLMKGNESLIKEIMQNGIPQVFPNGVVSWLPDKIEFWLMKWLISKSTTSWAKKQKTILASLDRFKPSEQTSQTIINWYCNSSLVSLNNSKHILACGHTHIADTIQEDFLNYYNLGSWLVEPEHLNPDTYVLLIDKEIQFEKILDS